MAWGGLWEAVGLALGVDREEVSALFQAVTRALVQLASFQRSLANNS